jgi:hypothetical protein
MTERPRPPAEPAPEGGSPAESPRSQWSREDDELLLLDELEDVDEAPDDERVDELV